MDKPWHKPATGGTFMCPTQFRPSAIPESGSGWWANAAIPNASCLRRVHVADGSLLRFASAAELQRAGWDPAEYVNYGICHPKEPECLFFLNPGTAMNHSSEAFNVHYRMQAEGEIEIWSVRDIEDGEELLSNYAADFGDHCAWYARLCHETGHTPLSGCALELARGRQPHA